MMFRGGPFPNFLSGQEVSTPWSACTAADRQHGYCSHTRYHTCKENKKKRTVSQFQRACICISLDGNTNLKQFTRHLKTHQEMSLTKLSLREIPAPASKMEE